MTKKNEKILWLENGDILGGAEIFSFEMIETLRNIPIDYSVEIIFCYGGENPRFLEKLEYIKNLYENHKNIIFSSEKIFFPRFRPFSFSNLKSFFLSRKKLKQKLLSENFSLLYTNTVRGFLLAGSFKKTPYRKIFMAHDFTFPFFFLSKISSFFQRGIACSAAVKDFFVKRGVKKSFINICPNGVSINDYKNYLVPEKVENFGIIGRIEPWKGQYTFLLSAKKFLETGKKGKFFIIGEPSSLKKSQEFFEFLKSKVKEWKQEENIVFTGFLETQKALKKLDAVVHASEEKEPFGRVPLEAAAAKKFLCVSNLGTPKEIFTQGEVLFFTPKNSDQLCDCFINIQKNITDAQKRSENAYKKIKEKYDLKKISSVFWKNLLE